MLASNRYFKQDEETQKEVSFFEVTTWSRLAEVCGEYLKKGRGVRVVGRLKQDRWTSPEGQGRSKISIVAEHVEFKPQLKKDGDGKDGEVGKAAEATAESPRRRAGPGGGRAQGGGELLGSGDVLEGVFRDQAGAPLILNAAGRPRGIAIDKGCMI